MVFPLVEHIPYCTFNHIIKPKLRHLVIKVHCSCAYQCLALQIQRELWQLEIWMLNSVPDGKRAWGSNMTDLIP